MINETPIMMLCDRVRNAFAGMEMCLRRASTAVENNGDVDMAMMEALGISECCKDIILVCDQFMKDINMEAENGSSS